MDFIICRVYIYTVGDLVMKLIHSRALSLVSILLIYVLAFTVGYFSFRNIENIYLSFFLMDVIATVVVFIFSVIFKNTSVYDPYWSFTPWVILTYFFIKFRAFDVFFIILYVVFSLWSFRLTINWIITFPNLTHEDWRYSDYRHNLKPFMFQIVNFFGLHMVPTILVYAGLLPMLVLFAKGSSVPLLLIGTFVMFLGIALEFIADHEMHDFLRNIKERVTCKKGLWNYSRHPNYLGENAIWVGSFLSLVVVLPSYWWLCFGFILMIMLFEFISIPLAERHHKSRRSDYVCYVEETSRMLLLPHKSH